MIQAKTVADSKNQFGNRLFTTIVTFPRIILAEKNTHRMLSKNSASSRAIPYRKMVETMFGENNLRFTPIAWQKEHKGMQGSEYFTDPQDIQEIQEIWDEAARNALMSSEKLNKKGVTKQLCNRLLEPFMWHTVIVSGTEWENFFALRCPKYALRFGNEVLYYRSRKDYIKSLSKVSSDPDFQKEVIGRYEGLSETDWLLINEGQAEIHMMALAEAIWDAYNESVPRLLEAGEWHIPYEEEINEMFDLTQNEVDKDGIPFSVKIGSIMAARTSYTVVGTELSAWSIDKYVEKCNELSSANPLHASPFEHCARAMSHDEHFLHNNGVANLESWNESQELVFSSEAEGWSGNFRGFIQYRKMLPNENITL